MEGLDILNYTGVGYKRQVEFGKWTVAMLNFADRFSEKGMEYIERHMETDEAFILLQGSAEMLIGMEMERVPMEIGKIYNVKKATWHNILVSKDAHVLIVENSDTCKANSEYHYLNK